MAWKWAAGAVCVLVAFAGCLAPGAAPDAASTQSEAPVPPAVNDLLLDLRVQGEFAGLVTSTTTKATQAFQVEEEYAFLAFRMNVEGPWTSKSVYAIRVTDHAGNVLAEEAWRGDNVYIVPPSPPPPFPASYPFAALQRPALGTYTVELEVSPGTTGILIVRGLGGEAPDFILEDVLGKGTFQPDEQRGKAVLVMTGTTECAVTARMMPVVVDLYAQIGRDELEIVFVDVYYPLDQEEDLRAYMESHGATWYAGFDEGIYASGPIQRDYQGGGTPTFAIIDARGEWVYLNSGEIEAETLLALVQDAAKTGGA